MKFTREALAELGWQSSCNKNEISVSSAVVDSRQVGKSIAFVAQPGESSHGKDYVFDAIENGAALVLVDDAHKTAIEGDGDFDDGQPIFYADDFLNAVAAFLRALYGSPDEKMTCIAVTGTNGKTSIAHGFYELLTKMKKKAAYIGTLGAFLGDDKVKTGYTTPMITDMYAFLGEAAKQEIEYVFVEASSHGIWQGRIHGIRWQLAIFTNLSPEHLDYHGDMNEYFAAKRMLFDQLAEAHSKATDSTLGAVVCTDNEYGQRLAEHLQGEYPDYPVVTLGEAGDCMISDVKPSWEGYEATLLYQQATHQLTTNFIGRFNVYNNAAIYLASLCLGLEGDTVLAQLAKLKPPPGRMEVIKADAGRHVVIDYAHSPDALENVLITLRELNPIRTICLFGCGGDRDRDKRPMMGRVASLNAEFVIITNDNPRSEDEQSIANDIKAGMESSRYIVIFDRERAIKAGLQVLGVQEVLLIAGKGHEEQQVIGDQIINFSDRRVAKNLLKDMEFDS